MKTKSALIILLLAVTASLAFAETVTLTTLLPHNVLRVKKAAIGTDINNPSAANYISDANLVTDALSLGVGYMQSFAAASPYFGIVQNMNWNNNPATRYVKGGPAFFQMGCDDAANDLGGEFIFTVYTNGAAGSSINAVDRAIPLYLSNASIDAEAATTYINRNYATANTVNIGSSPGGSTVNINTTTNIANAVNIGYATYSTITMCGSTLYTGGHFQAWPVGVSDIRLKKDVVTIPDALNRIDSIRGVNFRWKEDKEDDSIHAGVIAQEVEKAFPELVRTGKDGMKTVDYNELTGALIEGIKDLKKENEELRHRVELLEKKHP